MRIFWSFVRQAWYAAAMYRFELMMDAFNSVLMIYCMYWLWTILYRQMPGAFGLTREWMITYAALGTALGQLTFGGPQWYLAEQVRSGAIDTDLMKPLDLQVHMFARSVGEAAMFLIVSVLPPLAVGFAFFRVLPPVSPAAGLLFAASLALSILVLFGVNFLVGMLALVTLDIRSISWAYYGMMRFFSGAMVPLWLFPDWLGQLAGALPFRAIFAVPLSIYVGKLAGPAAWESMAFQLAWAAALALLGRLAWLRVRHRLVVQGG